MNVSFILAASIRELFPTAEIDQICSTEKCFFCDLRFPGEFSIEILPQLEERMRQWAKKDVEFNVMHMMPSNAAQMLDHHGDKSLAFKVKKQEGEVTLLQFDRFFFQIDAVPDLEGDISNFKLVCFWPLQNGIKSGIRIIGVGAATKDSLKEKAQALKTVKSAQKLLEEQGYVSWLGETLVWETRAEQLKDEIRQKVLEVYEGFDLVGLPEMDQRRQEKTLIDWIRGRKRGGVVFQKNRLPHKPKELWDVSISPIDGAWRRGDLNSYLHLITKFLTIFSFEYVIDDHRPERVVFHVVDSLGRKWPMSLMEWNKKQELVRMTLCLSYERCVALIVEHKGN